MSRVQLVSRSCQTIPSSHGSEATFHGHHLHRPLLLLVIWCPIVSLLNGIALYMYWKPKAISTARVEDIYSSILASSDGATTVDPSYYCFLFVVFLHFIMGHAFVVQRGVRILVGQRTSQQRTAEAQHCVIIFVLLTLPLFITHVAVSERLNIISPTAASSALSTNALEQEKASVAFVRLVLWGTLLSAVVAGWYWWIFMFSEKLQRGVRNWADNEAHARKSRQHDWHQQLAAVRKTARDRRHTSSSSVAGGAVARDGSLADAIDAQ